MRRNKLGCACILTACCGSAQALQFDLFGGGVEVSLNNRLSIGAAMRMQERSSNLLGKLNAPGQQNLCAEDNCLSLSGDPEPNLRLVRAGGAFSGVNGDDGNLNYDRYDVVAATTKLVSDMTVTWGGFLVRVRGLGYYDPVNVDFGETHTDTRFQPAQTERPDGVESRFAKGGKLLDAYVQYAFVWADRSGTIGIGNQTVRWGESTLIALNSLSEINPPNANLLRMPGSEINEVFQPVPVVLLSTDLLPGLSAEFVYQFGWKPVEPDARGSFFADSDLVGGSRFASVSLGQFGEDPDRQFRPAGELGALSSTTHTIYPEETEPEDGGQYGVRLNYFADWLNEGTELGFYFLNYHSRLPYATAIAANDSCARDSTSVPESYIDCEGFNGTLPRPPGFEGREPLPVDTMRAQIVYPEDIRMYGISFNTNLGSWSLAGEYSFRENVPMQVHITDLIFMALQPAFPAMQLESDPTGTGGAGTLLEIANLLGVPVSSLPAGEFAPLLSATFPAADVAIPSYLRNYRGISRVEANSVIPGYERMKVGQLDLTAIRAISSNPFAAEQILLILEAGFTQVYDMPSLDQLQFEGGGLNRTHYGPGADGTGTPDGEPDPRRLNPTRQTTGFADDFAWGLRSIVRFEYNDVIFGWGFKPTVIAAWDVEGIAPYPLQNFVEGRKEFIVGTEISFTQALAGRVLYQWFTGGGRDNTRRDRDNLALSVSYAF